MLLLKPSTEIDRESNYSTTGVVSKDNTSTPITWSVGETTRLFLFLRKFLLYWQLFTLVYAFNKYQIPMKISQNFICLYSCLSVCPSVCLSILYVHDYVRPLCLYQVNRFVNLFSGERERGRERESERVRIENFAFYSWFRNAFVAISFTN